MAFVITQVPQAQISALSATGLWHVSCSPCMSSTAAACKLLAVSKAGRPGTKCVQGSQAAGCDATSHAAPLDCQPQLQAICAGPRLAAGPHALLQRLQSRAELLHMEMLPACGDRRPGLQTTAARSSRLWFRLVVRCPGRCCLFAVSGAEQQGGCVCCARPLKRGLQELLQH